MPRCDVAVIGAGLAGLGCARELARRGRSVCVLEAGDGVGGRVRTDIVDGFRLDRGFQVLLTAYPETASVLDYAALELHPFEPGALVRCGGGFARVADPRRRPVDGLRAALGPVASVRDARPLGRLLRRALAGTLEDLWTRQQVSSGEALRSAGLSEGLINRFFRPFIGGVLLDTELATSSRMLEFVLRMFATGDTAVPASGIGAIPEQLAAGLPAGAVRLGVRATALTDGGVELAGGERVETRATVVATDGAAAAALIGWHAPPPARSVSALYFAADRAPVAEPILMLDGRRHGPVNNLQVMSEVARSYAPPGKALVSASVVDDPSEGDDERLEWLVRKQLGGWFGASEVGGWRHLRTYRVAHAQPRQLPDDLEPAHRPVRVSERLWVCGDHVEQASLHGALVAGRRAAEGVIGEL